MMNALENRQRLASATKAYFDELDPEAAREEQDLATALAFANYEIDFDEETPHSWD